MKWNESLWEDSTTGIQYYEPTGITEKGKIQSEFWQCHNCQSYLSHPISRYKITSRGRKFLEITGNVGTVKLDKVSQIKNLCRTCLKKLSKTNTVKLLQKEVKPSQVFHENSFSHVFDS